MYCEFTYSEIYLSEYAVLGFFLNTEFYLSYFNQDTEQFPHPPNSLESFVINPSPHPQVLGRTDLFSFPIVLPMVECHLSGMVQYWGEGQEGRSGFFHSA